MLAIRLLRQRQATTALQRTPTRAPRPTTFSHHPPSQIRNRRFQSNKPEERSDPTPEASRISRILATTSRFLPKRLQSSLENLRSAPFSHVCAFLVLHEITAIVPVLGLAGAFYALDWTPTNWILRPKGDDEQNTMDRGAVLGSELGEEAKGDEERKGLVRTPARFVTVTPSKGEADAGAGDSTSTAPTVAAFSEATRKTPIVAPGVEDSTKVELRPKVENLALQLAAAYGITKFLLVPRIALSLWLTPWLARGFVGFRQGLRRTRS